MKLAKEKRYRYYIGIDVSKNELDFAVFDNHKLLFHEERKNEYADIVEFVKSIKNLPNLTFGNILFVMEYTGIYCNPLLKALRSVKTNFAQVNALEIRNSSGIIRGKYDKIDAIRIGRFAVKHHSTIKLWQDRRPIIEQLSNLCSLRNRLIDTQTAIKKPINEQLIFAKEGIHQQTVLSCENTLTAIAADLKKVNKNIVELIRSDERLCRLHTLILSVPSVGPVTSIQIILSTNEFLTISDPKKFACYAGVVPFHKESGKNIGKGRVSKFANKKIKALLHMCAITAVRKQGELKDFFIRKTEIEGKHKMSVYNSIRNKLVLRIFACVHEDRMYQETYQPKIAI